MNDDELREYLIGIINSSIYMIRTNSYNTLCWNFGFSPVSWFVSIIKENNLDEEFDEVRSYSPIVTWNELKFKLLDSLRKELNHRFLIMSLSNNYVEIGGSI